MDDRLPCDEVCERMATELRQALVSVEENRGG
jgi:hypothetical protein